MTEHLMESALIGTEKKELDLVLLPEEVRVQISNRHESDAELQFLEAATLLHYFYDAGSGAALFSGEWNEEVIEETMTIAPEQLLSVFTKLESVGTGMEYLLNLWLSALAARRNIVSAEFVTRLLQTGKNHRQETKSKIIQVVGRKGQWIISHLKEFEYRQEPVSDAAWEEGTFSDRKVLFADWRRTNAALAITKLHATWSTESITNKKAFLEIIKETLAESDLIFIEELYGKEFKFQSKEKKTERECRRITAEILLRHRSSSLYKTTTEQLSSYFVKTKTGLLGRVSGKESVAFALPEEDDLFWNSSVMEQRFGFETKNIDIAVFAYPSQYWLYIFIQSLPSSFWAKSFDNDIKRMTNYFVQAKEFKTTIQGQEFSVFQRALIDNARIYNDRDLASSLIEGLSAAEVISLLSLLTLEKYESFMMKNNYLGDAEMLRHAPLADGEAWSPGFSIEVLQKAFDLSQQSLAPPVLGQAIAKFIHKGAGNELLRLHEKARDTSVYVLWNKNIFEPVFLSIEVRTIIDSLKN